MQLSIHTNDQHTTAAADVTRASAVRLFCTVSDQQSHSVRCNTSDRLSSAWILFVIVFRSGNIRMLVDEETTNPSMIKRWLHAVRCSTCIEIQSLAHEKRPDLTPNSTKTALFFLAINCLFLSIKDTYLTTKFTSLKLKRIYSGPLVFFIFFSVCSLDTGCQCVVFQSTGLSEGSFQSVGYPAPYPSGINCFLYTFIGDSDELVQLSFTHFDLHQHQSGGGGGASSGGGGRSVTAVTTAGGIASG